MKDFDGAREKRHAERIAVMGDRTFKIAGEEFTYRANVEYQILGEVSRITADMPGDQVIEILEGTVIGLIENHDGSHERFKKAVRDQDNPVTLDDLVELANWLVEEQVRRPTTAP